MDTIVEENKAINMTYTNVVTTFDYIPDWPNISATPKE